MKLVDFEKYDEKDEYNEIMSNGKTNKSTKELLNMYERLNSQDRNLMDEMTHEYHVHKVTVVQDALIRRYLESYGLPEWVIARCMDDIAWDNSEVNKIAQKLT